MGAAAISISCMRSVADCAFDAGQWHRGKGTGEGGVILPKKLVIGKKESSEYLDLHMYIDIYFFY